MTRYYDNTHPLPPSADSDPSQEHSTRGQNKKVSLALAREIMGDRLLEPADVLEVLRRPQAGAREKQWKEVPFSEEALRDMNYFLVPCTEISIEGLRLVFGSRPFRDEQGAYYNGQSFATETGEKSYRLIRCDLHPNTLGTGTKRRAEELLKGTHDTLLPARELVFAILMLWELRQARLLEHELSRTSSYNHGDSVVKVGLFRSGGLVINGILGHKEPFFTQGAATQRVLNT